VKILDFGLARFASEAASAAGLTSTGILLGTVDYIAPEQADNAHQADTRSDIYSLGCTLYHLLAGQPPFPTGTPLQKVIAHVQKKAQPLTELRDDLPEELVLVLERMMAKDPKHRYQTPADVALALEPFTRAAAVARAPKPQSRVQATDTDRTIDVPKKPAGGRWRSRLTIATATLAFLVAVLVGVGIYRIATDYGVLEIQADNEDVEVVVCKGGEVVKIIDVKSGKHVTLNSGEYDLALKDPKEGLSISPAKMTVWRGERMLATIERVSDSGLIKNGSFETGMEGWNTHGPPSRFEFDRDVVRKGRQSLRVTASEATDCGCFQMVDLNPWRWYHLSGWVRTRGLKAHGESSVWGTIVIARANGLGHPDRQILAKGENHEGDTEWTRISLRFKPPETGKVNVLLTLAYSDQRSGWFGGTGTIWFDELKLVEESEPAG
jgi:hypothetical protein